MNIWENITVALQGLIANKMRSILTMLGIIIGVLAVIVGTAIGQGSRQEILERIQSLGSNVITVRAGAGRQGRVSGGQGSSQRMTMADVEEMQKNCPTVIAVAPDRATISASSGLESESDSMMSRSVERSVRLRRSTRAFGPPAWVIS